MSDSIFTKILRGDIPGEVIYQDDTCFVILTIQPMTPGHMLIIPKQEIDHLWDIDDTTYHHLFDVAKQMQAKLKKAYPNYLRIGLIIEGFGVPHAHIHVFGLEDPLEETTLEFITWKRNSDNPMASSDDLHTAAEKLRAA
ncbi:MAG: Histidine triad family protein [Candidatus Saccharibacteria bacterium]|nr:Histidine triad family protein [Candidatus Saccharibacteria bacterium]